MPQSEIEGVGWKTLSKVQGRILRLKVNQVLELAGKIGPRPLEKRFAFAKITHLLKEKIL